MQTSPLQTRSIIYRKVHIVPRMGENGQALDLKATEFDWTDVKMAAETKIGTRPDQEGDPTDFLAVLRIEVPNSDGLPCPYELDLEIAAVLQLDRSLPADRREDLALVNGLAIAYSSLRELVLNVTSRMEYGALVLPGVNFQDQAQRRDVPSASKRDAAAKA